jgi:CheY-like chemotaxis protein
MPLNRKGKVLLMDDDAVIRFAVCNLLDGLGYETAACKDGNEVVALYKQALEEDSPFDVAILDLHVPEGMGGKKAMKELLALDPGAKGVISSGFPNDAVMKDYMQFGFSGAVEKPYKIEDLDVLLTGIISPPSR